MTTLFDDWASLSLRITDLHGNLVTLPRGHSTGWRTLPFFMFSQAGRGTERVWLADGRMLEAANGAMVLLPGGVRHKVDVVSATELRQWIHVNFQLFDSVDLFSLFEIPPLVDHNLGTQAGEWIAEWVRERDKIAASGPLCALASNHAFALRLLALVSPLCRWRPDGLNRLNKVQRLSPVVRHIREHLAEPMVRDELARLAGLSPAQFHVVFHEAMGVQPMEYLRRLRLQTAQHLLITTDEPVAAIGRRCGYEDPFVFSKAFKRFCSQNPRRYRQRILDQWDFGNYRQTPEAKPAKKA